MKRTSLKWLYLKLVRQTEWWTIGFDFWVGIVQYYWSCLANEILAFAHDQKKRNYSFYR